MYAHDIGSQVAVLNGFTLALTSAAAGITTASTAALGQVIDRTALTGNYQSCKNTVALFSRATSTSGSAYCTVGISIEDADSSESTSFSAFTTSKSYTFGCTSEIAATNTYGTHSQDVDLSGAGRYIRQVVTITKVATSSADTVQAEGVLIFGGGSVLPAT